jgi:branched-chain amino acid transport system permease protein
MSLTGGDDGLSGIPRPVLSLLDHVIVDFSNVFNFYYLVVLFFILTYLSLKSLIGSPMGRLFVGIKENEHRMGFVGFNVRGYKLLSFVIASFFGGIAGALHAGLNGFISPKAFFWTSSGEVLLMVIIGGTGTLIGPILGAFCFIVSKNYISSYTEHWMLFIGILFVIFVLFAEKGMIGLIRKIPVRKRT